MFGYMTAATPSLPATNSPATATMLAMSSGLSPTDPRLQPFLRSARDEHVRLHMSVLVSNGMSESQAKEEAERAASDRMQFFGQAVVKYFSSLSGTCQPQHQTSSNYDSTLALISLHAQQQHQLFAQHQAQMSVQQQQQQRQGLDLTGTTPSSTELNLGPLRRLFQQPSDDQRKPCPLSAPSSVIAGAGFSLRHPDSSSHRFDNPIAITPPQTGPPAVRLPVTTPAIAVTEAPATAAFMSWEQQQLEKALQQWTYKVYSCHQTTPAGLDPKFWRSKLLEFVNNHVTQARTVIQSANRSPMYFAVCSWLSNCRVPSVDEVSGRVQFISAPAAAAVSVVPPPPPPPEDDQKNDRHHNSRRSFVSSKQQKELCSLSPISSSSSTREAVKRGSAGKTSRKQLATFSRRLNDNSDTSSSSMSSASSNRSKKRTKCREVQRLTNPAISQQACFQPVEFALDIIGGGSKKNQRKKAALNQLRLKAQV